MKLEMLEQCEICPGRFVRLTADNDQVNPEVPRRYCTLCGEELVQVSKIKASSFDSKTGEPRILWLLLACPNWHKPKRKFFKKEWIRSDHDKVKLQKNNTYEDAEWETRAYD